MAPFAVGSQSLPFFVCGGWCSRAARKGSWTACSTRFPAPSTRRRTASPAALRARRPSWRDPRLVLGVVLLCGSVVTGARILDGADDTVAVLAVQGPLAAGQVIEASELTTVRLRFADETDAERYLPGGSEIGGAVALRALGAGELVPRDAVGSTGPAALTELPLTLHAGRVPAAVRVGLLGGRVGSRAGA